MKRISKNQERHDKLVYRTVDRLMLKTERVKGIDSISTKLEYRVGRMSGEVDILTRTSEGNYHFYEVKGRHSEKGLEKAQEQFDRFCEAYPTRKIKGVYITPNKVLRLHYLKSTTK